LTTFGLVEDVYSSSVEYELATKVGFGSVNVDTYPTLMMKGMNND